MHTSTGPYEVRKAATAPVFNFFEDSFSLLGIIKHATFEYENFIVPAILIHNLSRILPLVPLALLGIANKILPF